MQWLRSAILFALVLTPYLLKSRVIKASLKKNAKFLLKIERAQYYYEHAQLYLEITMDLFFRIIGACIFLPFIGFYSYILGPILKLILLTGGLLLLLLILGKKDGIAPLIEAFKTKTKTREGIKAS